MKRYKIKAAVCVIVSCAIMTGCGSTRLTIGTGEVSESMVQKEMVEEVNHIAEKSTVEDTAETRAEDLPWERFPFPYAYSEEDRDTKENYFTLKEVLDDYDIMWEQLEENSPYLIMAEEMGIDLEEVKRKGRSFFSQVLGENKVIKGEGILWALNRGFDELKWLGHISAVPPENYEYLKTALTQNVGDLTKGFGKVMARQTELMTNEKTDKLYEYILTDRFGTGEERKKNEAAVITKDEIEIGKVGTGIPYIKIKTCNEKDIDEIRNFLKENEKAENIIIDMQGNTGGNTLAWREGIVAPLIQEPVKQEKVWAIKSGRLNQYYWDGEQPDYTLPDPISKEEREKTLQNMNSKDDDTLQYVLVKSTISPSQEHFEFEGRLWLLVDEKVYSASDAFTLFCKEQNFATIVGKVTSGNGGGTQPQCIALPNTGVLIYYDAFMSFNSDGSCNGIHGEQPDIEVQDGEDALEVCLKAIEASE